MSMSQMLCYGDPMEISTLPYDFFVIRRGARLAPSGALD